MARRRQKAERDRSSIASFETELLRPIRPAVAPIVYVPRSVLPEVEDRRVFHPVKKHRPALLVSGLPAQLKIRKPQVRGRVLRTVVPRGVSFEAPRQVAVCVRRKDRREVLFANRQTRRGAGARRRRRNWWSEISCRST